MKTDKNLGSVFVTLGIDIETKFAWCIRKVDGVECVCLHEREGGMSCFSENDYITAIPVDRILKQAGKV